jgi:carbon-monoxide dehydrogenase small subunit
MGDSSIGSAATEPGIEPAGGVDGHALEHGLQHGAGLTEHYTLHVNGVSVEVRDAWIGESLLYVLRERAGLIGSKGACEQGECGSCSVLVDGELVCSCLVMAASAVGQPVVTIEGVAPLGAPSDVQRAFVEAGAVQCGFCTPGLIMAAHALLERSPQPGEVEIREELSGNVCRCTGYGRIIDAVQRVSVSRRERSGS